MPVGTQILATRRTLLADLDEVGKRIVIAEGGDGGHGNAHFKSPTNRSPRRADQGWPGEERWIWLRLKLIADVGLVGLPNAGKSTFLAAVSAARPKIADYPFTTLIPQLGVVRLNASEEFVLADIPGLIEGAHEGVGLGDRFLGHVERCAVLLHLVDGSQPDPAGAWRTVREELEQYGQGLAEKPELLCLNKVDAMTPQARASRVKALERAAGVPVMLISGATGEQVPQVLRALANIVAQARTERAERTPTPASTVPSRTVVRPGQIPQLQKIDGGPGGNTFPSVLPYSCASSCAHDPCRRACPPPDRPALSHRRPHPVWVASACRSSAALVGKRFVIGG